MYCNCCKVWWYGISWCTILLVGVVDLKYGMATMTMAIATICMVTDWVTFSHRFSKIRAYLVIWPYLVLPVLLRLRWVLSIILRNNYSQPAVSALLSADWDTMVKGETIYYNSFCLGKNIFESMPTGDFSWIN